MRGDAGILPWMITFLYLAAGVASFYFANTFKQRSHYTFNRYEPFFWYTISIFLVFLAFNKQLDLQTLLSAIGRESALRNNWYEVRRTYQAWFIGAIAISSFGLLSVFIFVLRDTLKKNILALAGIFILVVFIQLRAVSFHHLDRLLEINLMGVGFHWILEVTGATFIIFSVYKQVQNERSQH